MCGGQGPRLEVCQRSTVTQDTITHSPPGSTSQRGCVNNPLPSKHEFVIEDSGQDGGKTAEEAKVRSNVLNKRPARGMMIGVTAKFRKPSIGLYPGD